MRPEGWEAREARRAAACSGRVRGQGCFLDGAAGGAGVAGSSLGVMGRVVWVAALWASGAWNSGRSQRTRPRASSAALAVQVHEPAQDLVIGEVAGPAVGVEHRRVQVVVKLLEDRDEPLLVDGPLLVRQGLAGAERLQDVVEGCYSEERPVRESLFAMGVQFFAKL